MSNTGVVSAITACREDLWTIADTLTLLPEDYSAFDGLNQCASKAAAGPV